MRRGIPTPRPTPRPKPRLSSLSVSPVDSGGARVAEESDLAIVDVLNRATVLDGEAVALVIVVTA